MGYPWQLKRRPSTPRQQRLDALVLLATGVGIAASVLLPIFVLDWLDIPHTNKWVEWPLRIISIACFLLTLRWGTDLSERIARGHFDPPPTGHRPEPIRTSCEPRSSENANI